MSVTVEESLHERVKAVAIELEHKQEEHEIAAAETTNDFKQERFEGKAIGFELSAKRLRTILDDGGDADE